MNKDELLILNYNIYRDYSIFNTAVTLDDIVNIYNFDIELKTLLFKNLLLIEKHFKSIVILEYYKQHSEFDYINTNSMLYLFNDIKKHYFKDINNVAFKDIINYLTLGQVIKFTKLQNKDIQNNIAKNFSNILNSNNQLKNILLYGTVISFLENIRQIRNIVAHNNRLFYFKARENAVYFENIHKIHNIDKRKARQDFYNVIITFSCFLTVEQLQEFNNDFSNIKTKLANKLNQTVYNNLLHSLGLQN